MNSTVTVSRLRFLGSSAAAAGSLAVGFHIPDSPLVSRAAAQGVAPEVNAWVVVKPDDTVVVRIARSEKPGAVHIELPEDIAKLESKAEPLEPRRLRQ